MNLFIYSQSHKALLDADQASEYQKGFCEMQSLACQCFVTNQAKCNNLIKVYAAATDTREVVHIYHFC